MQNPKVPISLINDNFIPPPEFCFFKEHIMGLFYHGFVIAASSLRPLDSEQLVDFRMNNLLCQYLVS